MFDAAGMDRSFQAINQVEASWGLPRIPDMVKLDLISQANLDPQALAAFAQGIASDLEQEVSRPSELVTPTAVDPSTFQPQFTPGQNFQRNFAAIAGVRAPRVLANDSVARWKQRAISLGYLDEATPIDEAWAPEYRGIAFEMSRDDFARRIQGDKPGAVSVSRLAEIAEDWLTPTGLIRAAIDLDLVWDPDAIGREFQSWGDKWRSFVDDPSPKGLIDALTGPVDDLVVPGINMLLLFSGVGSAVAFARAGYMLKAGLSADKLLDGYYGTRALVNASRKAGAPGRVFGDVLERGFMAGPGKIAEDVARMQQPSFLSQKLGATSWGKSQAAVMDKWRALPTVMATKRTVQAGMRLGVASRTQDLLLPGEDRGISLGDVTTLDEWATAASKNPLVWGLGEALFTPYNIMQPGFFKGALVGTGRAGLEVAQATGNTIERLSKGHLGTGFAKVTENDQFTNEFLKATLDDLTVNGSPEKLAEFERNVERFGPAEAMAIRYTGGDRDALNVMGSYVAIAAAIDAWALDSVKAFSKLDDAAIRSDAKGRRMFHTLRNKAIAQLRDFDPDDLEGALLHLRFTTDELGGSSKKLAEMRELLLAGDEATASTIRNLATKHNRTRDGFLRDILDNFMTPDTLRNYLPRVSDTFGNWVQFSDSMGMVDQAVVNGALKGAAYKTAKSPEGRLLGLGVGRARTATTGAARRPTGTFEDLDDPADLVITPGQESDEAVAGFANRSGALDEIDTELDLTIYERALAFNPMARWVDPAGGQFTVAGIDTVTKQELIETAARGRHLLDLRKQWQKFQTDGVSGRVFEGLRARANLEGRDLTQVEINVLEGWIDTVVSNMGMASNVERSRDIKRLMRWAKKEDVSLEDFGRALDDRIEAMNAEDIWHVKYQMDVAENATLDRKVKELQRQVEFTAAEVDLDTIPPEMARFLTEKGYKLVHGVNFMTPGDVLSGIADGSRTFTDITAAHQRSITLGNFFGRQNPEEIGGLAHRIRRQRLMANFLADARAEKKIDIAGTSLVRGGQVDEVLVDRTLDDVQAVLREIQGEAQEMLMKSALEEGYMGRLGTRLKTINTPVTAQDLSLSWHQKRLVQRLQDRGYSKDAAEAVWRSLKESRKLGFSNRGLLEVENHLRSNPNLTNGLRLLGKVDLGDTLGARSAGFGARFGGMVAGGGLAVFDEVSDPEGAEGGSLELIARGVAGAFVGRAGANAALRGLGGSQRASGVMNRAADRWDNSSKWSRYAYLGDNLANLRDVARFSLSPIFDLSRYTEGLVLAQINPGAGNLRLNQSPRGFRRMLRKEYEAAGNSSDEATRLAGEEWRRISSEFRAGVRGEEFDALEDSSRWFTQQGILGFSPTDWMLSTYGHLRRAGKSTDEANEIVRSIYTYGTTGRSAAELSANFVFFPFSFMKKTLGHMTQFLSQDLSRAIILQDMLKTYDILNEEYDLSQVWRDKLPLLQSFQRLNLFAYGISPGELGGPNRPLWDFFRSTPAAEVSTTPVLNLFLPQGVKITNRAQSNDVQQLTRRLLPVMNDTNAMVRRLQEQGHVLFGGNFMTEQAEVSRAYDELAELKRGIDARLREGGHNGFSAIYGSDPQLQQIRGAYEAERARIARKYPAWRKSNAQFVANSIALETELKDRLASAVTATQLGSPLSARDRALLQWDQLEQNLEGWLAMNAPGVTLSRNPEDIPPEIWQEIRSLAVQMAREVPGFDLDWVKFYQRKYGPITMELI